MNRSKRSGQLSLASSSTSIPSYFLALWERTEVRVHRLRTLILPFSHGEKEPLLNLLLPSGGRTRTEVSHQKHSRKCQTLRDPQQSWGSTHD